MKPATKCATVVSRILALTGLAIVSSPVGASAQQLLFEGAELQINTYTTNSQSGAAGRSVARSGNGSFIVVWESGGQDGSFRSIYAQRFDSTGAPTGTEFQVNTYTTYGQRRAAVASDSDGDFVVAWTSYQDGSSYSIRGQRYDSAGAPAGTEFQISSYATNNQDRSAVAMHVDGAFVVTWDSSGQDGSGSGVHGQRFDSTGAPAGTEFQVNTYTTNSQLRPAVATTGGGKFVVAWETFGPDGASGGIAAQRYDAAGNAEASEFIVNSYTSQNESLPAVASDGSGSFVVVWTSNQDPDMTTSIHGQRFDSVGAALGTEFKANSYTTGLQLFPGVAMDGDGSFVVVWESSGGEDGSSYGVIGQRYDSSGAPDGADFIVNTYTTSVQDSPSIAVDGIGNFTVVWNSVGQDGPSSGVFGQRLCADGNGNLVCDGDEITTTTTNTVTTTSSTTSTTTTTLSAVASCPAAPDPGCIGAVRAKMQYSEKSAGREKMKIQWSAVADATVQADFGDPVDGATGIAACIYDDGGVLVAQFQIDRAGQLCDGKPCWKKKGAKGYGYKDKGGTADGTGKLSLLAGEAGRGKASISGKNNSTKGQADLPTGVVADLTLNIEPTLQIIAGDGVCVSAKINSVTKDDGFQYKAVRGE